MRSKFVFLKLLINSFYLNIQISFTLPNDCTPLDNAKKQISQATAKATTK